MSYLRLRVANTGAPDLYTTTSRSSRRRFGSALWQSSFMRHLRKKMGIITAIPVANDVNRDEALIRTPIPAANGGNRYEATRSISEELRRQNDRLQLLLNLTSRITSS